MTITSITGTQQGPQGQTTSTVGNTSNFDFWGLREIKSCFDSIDCAKVSDIAQKAFAVIRVFVCASTAAILLGSAIFLPVVGIPLLFSITVPSCLFLGLTAAFYAYQTVDAVKDAHALFQNAPVQ